MNTEISQVTQNGNGTASSADHPLEADAAEENLTKAKARNPFSKSLEPGWHKSAQPLDFTDEMLSDEFCAAKLAKVIIEPQEFQSKEEWIKAAEAGWEWLEKREERLADLEADQLLGKIVPDELLFKSFRKKFEVFLRQP